MDGFSEAFTQEEEARPPAGLHVLGGGAAWSSLHLKSFRNLSRGERK